MYMHLARLTLNVFGWTFQRAIVVTLLAAHFFFVVVLKTTIRTLFVKTTSILVVTSILGSNKWQLSSSLQFYKYCLLLHVGVDVGNRWKDLYHLWESHTDDHILVRAVISLCTPFLSLLIKMKFFFSGFQWCPHANVYARSKEWRCDIKTHGITERLCQV